MTGRIHFLLYVLMSALAYFAPFKLDGNLNELAKETITEIKNAKNPLEAQLQTRLSFAEKYFSQLTNQKITILNFNYFTVLNGKIFFIEKGYNNKYLNVLINSKLKRSMLKLYQLNPGDVVTILGYKIEKTDKITIYPDDITIEISHNNETFNLPLELYELKFLNKKKEEFLPSEEIYPKSVTTCENIWKKGNSKVDLDELYPVDKNIVLTEAKTKQEQVKLINPYLTNIGEIYLKSNDTFCFDATLNNELEEVSLLINEQYIFKPRYK